MIGCSGGPDSVCLLDIFCQLKDKYGLGIVVAHVNYGLRKKDSELDEKLVSGLAKKYSLPVEIIRTGRYSPKSANLEEKLRNFRYNFFREVQKKHKAGAIAVAHNRGDQAETVIMRIVRGTGLRGLGAIKFKNGNIIRPFLNVSRKEILDYLRKNKIGSRTDKTNFEDNFTRNKIRNQLLPQIAKDFNPNIEEALYNLSQSVAEDYSFIRLFSSEWLKAKKNLSVADLRKLHPSIRKEVLRLAIEEYNPNLRKIEFRHIDEIMKIIKSNKSKTQETEITGLKIKKKGDKLIISKA
ncbi:MAG: tRNA lysidine(34) synthetase TilS [Parcubacteria group bacterium]